MPEDLRIVHDAEAIADRVQALARDIEAMYGPADRLLLVGLLKGSWVFLADLARALRIPVQVDFMAVSSYGDDTTSSGRVKIESDTRLTVKGRNVLLVEDIVDSGLTLDRVVALVEKRGARSVEVCTLLHKRIATPEHTPRFVGFDAPNEFLVGYGLDHAEDFRHLPYIASL